MIYKNKLRKLFNTKLESENNDTIMAGGNDSQGSAPNQQKMDNDPKSTESSSINFFDPNICSNIDTCIRCICSILE
jgi:hypothetical protein